MKRAHLEAFEGQTCSLLEPDVPGVQRVCVEHHSLETHGDNVFKHTEPTRI